MWTAVAQRGWRPEARWASAIAYAEYNKQLFIFGGSGASGSCRNDVYCCDLDPNRAGYRLTELHNQIKDIDVIAKRLRAPSKVNSPAEYQD